MTAGHGAPGKPAGLVGPHEGWQQLDHDYLAQVPGAGDNRVSSSRYRANGCLKTDKHQGEFGHRQGPHNAELERYNPASTRSAAILAAVPPTPTNSWTSACPPGESQRPRRHGRASIRRSPETAQATGARRRTRADGGSCQHLRSASRWHLIVRLVAIGAEADRFALCSAPAAAVHDLEAHASSPQPRRGQKGGAGGHPRSPCASVSTLRS